jgi:hypothetical protein
MNNFEKFSIMARIETLQRHIGYNNASIRFYEETTKNLITEIEVLKLQLKTAATSTKRAKNSNGTKCCN